MKTLSKRKSSVWTKLQTKKLRTLPTKVYNFMSRPRLALIYPRLSIHLLHCIYQWSKIFPFLFLRANFRNRTLLSLLPNRPVCALVGHVGPNVTGLSFKMATTNTTRDANSICEPFYHLLSSSELQFAAFNAIVSYVHFGSPKHGCPPNDSQYSFLCILNVLTRVTIVKHCIFASLRIVDYMSDIRLIFGRPEHRYQAPGTVKIQTGQ